MKGHENITRRVVHEAVIRVERLIGAPECSILTECIVDEAIQPAFLNFRRCDNWMVTRPSVLARVAIRSRIAAEGAAARLAGAQMYPAIAGLPAFFALAAAWSLDAADRVDEDMSRASCRDPCRR